MQGGLIIGQTVGDFFGLTGKPANATVLNRLDAPGFFDVVWGRLADMFGTKRLYVAGLAAFAIVSVGVAAAPGFWQIVGARVIQGASGTVIPSISMATIVKTTTPETRGRAIGATVVAVGVGFEIGRVPDTLPQQFDRPMDWLVTEAGVAKPRA